MTEPLRLRAQDSEDMQIISACLQDAVTLVSDMTYLPRAKRFAAMFNRYRWERQLQDNDDLPDDMKCERIRTGIHFDGILKVESLNIPRSPKNAPLELLAIDCLPGEDGAATITLVFAGDGLVRLEAECVECQMSDISAPWPTRCKPDHPED